MRRRLHARAAPRRAARALTASFVVRSNSAVTFVANERGLPDEPYFEAGGVYVAMLREPRARYLSQYLHMKQYGEAYLRVRAKAAGCTCLM